MSEGLSYLLIKFGYLFCESLTIICWIHWPFQDINTTKKRRTPKICRYTSNSPAFSSGKQPKIFQPAENWCDQHDAVPEHGAGLGYRLCNPWKGRCSGKLLESQTGRGKGRPRGTGWGQLAGLYLYPLMIGGSNGRTLQNLRFWGLSFSEPYIFSFGVCSFQGFLDLMQISTWQKISQLRSGTSY